MSWINQLRMVMDFSAIICKANYNHQKISFKCHRVILYYTFPHPQSSLGGCSRVGEKIIKRTA